MSAMWAWAGLGLAVLAGVGWVAALVAGAGRAGAGVRLAGTAVLLAAGAAAGYGGAAGTCGAGPAPARLVLGALVGYLAGRVAGWAFDRVRRRRLRGTVLARAVPADAREYRLRTVLLPGATVAGLAVGLAGAGGGLGLLLVVALALLRREFFGAPLVALALALLVVVLPLGVLRARAQREVALRIDDEALVLRYRARGEDWQRHDLPLARLRQVTAFADPYGRGRMLRVDAGALGRFEVRAAFGLSARGAAGTLRRASRDLLGRPGWRPAAGVRPLGSRWGTRRYRAATRDNR